ncbi:MAG: hypothetical protein AAAC47_08880 [Pararhizobium sp.]
MNAQQTTRYWIRPGAGWRPGIKIGACAIVIGLFFAFACHVAVSDTKEHVAVDSGIRKDQPTRLQAAVDASPAFEVALATKPGLPASVIPTMKPVASQKRATSGSEGGRAATRGKMPPGVLRFDRCIPKCETQDPLIVGYEGQNQYPAYAPLMASSDDDGSFKLSPLQRARHILGRTADLPRAALRRGRDVIDSIVPSD